MVTMDRATGAAEFPALWRSLEAVQGKRSPYSDPRPESDGDESLPLRLTGRYRVGDGNEFPCEFLDLSPLGLRLRGPKSGELYKWCTASIASVGLIEGLVVEAKQSSFVVGVIAPPRRLQRLAQRLHWQALRNAAKVQERRASERVEMNNASGAIETEDGRSFVCEATNSPTAARRCISAPTRFTFGRTRPSASATASAACSPFPAGWSSSSTERVSRARPRAGPGARTLRRGGPRSARRRSKPAPSSARREWRA